MLPCMLPPTVSNRALDELVAYRRIKERANNMCKECVTERRKRTKRCASCGYLYDDEHGRIPDEAESAEELSRIVAGMK